jgi:hypothetical protein
MSNKQPARLANRTQWALQDIVAACARGKRHLDAMRERNNALMDPLMAVHLSHLSDVLATIEVTTVLASTGEYRQELKRSEA